MKLNCISNKGFTLIELLVVVAIIGLLSSIVFASLNSARGKAKDAAIKQELNQIAAIMELNYEDYGGYSQLQPNSAWAPNNANCSNLGLTGTYAAQMVNICTYVLSVTGNHDNSFYPGNIVNENTNFSVMVWLPYSAQWACVGSSGAKSFTTTSQYTTWVGPGCYGNP